MHNNNNNECMNYTVGMQKSCGLFPYGKKLSDENVVSSFRHSNDGLSLCMKSKFILYIRFQLA